MKILSLNGGGMRGFVTALILAKAENNIGKSLRESVDLITGVSTGSIIGAALANGMAAQRVVSMYRELQPAIFGNRRNMLRWLFNSRFPSDGLMRVLRDNMNTPLGELETRLMIPAYRISGADTGYTREKFWKSWREGDAKTSLWEVCMASSAAPGMFDPVKIGDEYYVDGGVAANNPSTCAIAEGIQLGAPLSHISILHIGSTPLPAIEKPASFRGLLNTMTSVPGLMVDATVDVIGYQCQRLLGDRYLSIASNPINHPDVTFDSNDFDRMTMYASILWRENEDRIMAFLEQ